MNAYLANLLVLAVIAAINASSLTVLNGDTGVFNAAGAILFGVGAFASAQTAIHVTSNVFVLIIAAVGATMVVSLLLALPAARVVGDYFVVASLAFAVIGYTVFQNADALTGGPEGLIGIPAITVFGYKIRNAQGYFILGLVFLVVALVVLRIVVRSPFGRSLTALRDDAVAAKALGKNPFRLRVAAVVVSAGISGLAGVLYASYIGFVDAASFSPNASLLIIATVILGGAGTLAGPLVGAAFITFFPALLNATSIPSQYKGPAEQLLYGLALVLLMMLRPDGIAGIGKSIINRFRRHPQPATVAGADSPLAVNTTEHRKVP